MSLRQRYEAALAAGDFDTAEDLLRGALAQTQDQQVLVLLGNLLRKRGKLDEAEVLLKPAADAAPTPELLDRLAIIQYQRQNFAGCERTLDRLIQMAPGQTSLEFYQLLAKLKVTRGASEEARAVMVHGIASRPGATDFVAAYSDMLPGEEAIRELENHLKAIDFDRRRLAYVLARITMRRAALLRSRSGSDYYGKSWPDTYRWPDQESLPALKQALLQEVELGTKRASAWLDLGCVAIAEGDWERAETCFAKLRDGSKRTVADFFALGSAFHAALEAMSDEDIVGGLVPTERILSPASRSDGSIFIGSDKAYFDRFTLAFLRQVDAARLPLDIHVHILDGAVADWAAVRASVDALNHLRVTLTAEASGAAARGIAYARQYYHSIRYVRVFEELKRSQRPIFVFDADVQLLRDPRPLFASLAGHDVALATIPAEFSPDLKITATCVGLTPTARGLEFTRRVAASVIHWKNRRSWGWGVDQLGIFSAYAFMASQARQPSTWFLDSSVMNDKTGDSGFIKFLSGIDKYGGS